MMPGVDNSTSNQDNGELFSAGTSHGNEGYDEQHRMANVEAFYANSYSASSRAGWMHQIEPVPLEHFPIPQGPVVYEGFVPSSSIDPGNSLQHSSSHATNFSWPPSQVTHVEAHQPGFSNYPHLHDPYETFNGQLDVENSDQAFATDLDYTDLEEFHLNENDLEVEAPAVSLRRSTRPRRGKGYLPKPPKAERRRGRRKGEKRGPREVLDPGEEFNALHAQATEAFLDKQDYDTAIECILQAISINPEIHSAHVLLSEIYFAQGENDKAMAALFSGAHAAPNDPTIWHQLADVCLQSITDDRETALKQATYCFSRILGIDQKDSDARFQKAAISKELGYYAKALKDLDVLLKEMPYNASVLRHIAEVCLELGDVTKARNLYEEALEERRSGRSEVEEVFTWDHLIVYVDLVSHADGIATAVQTLKEIARWLVGRGDEYYWTSITDDDREWDGEHEPRRVKTPAFEDGKHPIELYGASLPLDIRVKLGDFRLAEGNKREALSHFVWLEPSSRGEGSNVYEYTDLFLQTADSLREHKDFQNAYLYYDALNCINAYDDVDFWSGIGACAYVCDAKDEAIQYFENAKSLEPRNAESYTQLSKLYADKGDRSTAINNARHALLLYENAVGRKQKRKYERKEVREAREEAQAAYKKAYMLTPPPGEERTKYPAPSFSRRAREKRRRAEREAQEVEDDSIAERMPQDRGLRRSRFSKRRATQAQRSKEQQAEVIRQIYSTLDSQTEAMRTGDEEARSIWMECAESLIDEFRSYRAFYPAERYMKFRGYDLGHDQGTYPSTGRAETGNNGDEYAPSQEDIPLPSVESSIPNDYCGIPFRVWLDIFLEYALLLANLQYEPAECYTILTAAQDCVIWYHDPDAMMHIYTCYLVCALALHDEATLFSTAGRWFMREFAFCSDVYRLFSVLNFYYPHAADKGGKSGQMLNAKFRVAPNQKFIFRHVVSLDGQLPEDYGSDNHYGPVPAFMRKERREVSLGYLRFKPSSFKKAGPRLETQKSKSAHPSAGASDASSGGDMLKPVEMEIHLLILYGQILYAGGSFPNALSYFYRAMTLDPNNSSLLLTMALCYLHQMLKRQCDNRHAYYLQGLALFERYAETRIAWAEDKVRRNKRRDKETRGLVETVKREVEFNRARCWQMVGMVDLAIRGYSKMMDLQPMKREDEDAMDIDNNDEENDNGNDYSMEAAYSMALVYASSGDMATAKEITERWLVVE